MLLENRIENIHIYEFETYDFPVHLHQNVELTVCTEGTLQVCCNNKTKILNRGDIMIAYPYDTHSCSRTDYGKGITLIFDPNVSPILSDRFKSKKYNNFTSNELLIDVLHNLCTEFEADSSFLTMYGYLHMIVAAIVKRSDADVETLSEEDLFVRTLKYINTNFADPITLKSVASELGVSEQHLSRLFAENFPEGFCRYLNILRIEYAKELLRTTDKKVGDILTETGFTNQRTFNRVFREYTAMSPVEYRKECTCEPEE